MILAHGLNSLPRGSSDPDVIGGRKYRTVTIGEQTWLAENLDFQFPGLVVGANGTSSSEPRGNYYGNDESTYGVNGNKYGLLYNWIAIKYLNNHKSDLIPGWHVPTADELDALATAVGGTSVAGTKLKSTTDWSSGAGTDNYGFSALPAGLYLGYFDKLGSITYIWTINERTGTVAIDKYFDKMASMNSGNHDKFYQFSVRLVKDA